MKSYNQLNEDTYSVFLKEWNALSEETRREILEEIIEANELEVSEEELKEAALALTSPIWAPKVAGAVMTAVGASGLYNMWRNRSRPNVTSSGDIKWRDKPLPRSSRTDTQRSSSNSKVTSNYTSPNPNNKNNKPPGNKGKIIKRIGQTMVGAGIAGAANKVLNPNNSNNQTKPNYTLGPPERF